MFAIDVNTFFGTLPGQRTDYRLGTLLDLMEQHGIATALILSLRGVHDDHVAGNAETLAACRANPRLIPVATINPLRGLGLEADLEQIKAGGFRAVRLYAGEAFQDMSPDSLSFQRVLQGLAPLRLPIIASATVKRHIAALARATADLGLPLLFVETSYDAQAEIEEAARRYPQVFVDTARLATPGAIEVLADTVGYDRILYGSGMPRYAPQASMNVIFQADLSDEQRAQILAGNALRLFGLDQTTMQPQHEAAKFRGYIGPKIDVHAHLHADNYRFPIAAAGADVALEQCRRYNIEVMIASSAPGIFYDMQAGNQELKTIIDAHPQFRGYVVTNPNLLEESCAEMDTYYRFDNFVGAKIHCEYSHQPTAGPKMRALFAEIARRGRPVKIHNDGPGWAEAIRDLAQAHPQLAIIIAHGGPPGTGRIVADAPNVYLEFCSSAPIRGVIQDALEAIGPERLLFGTDQDLLHPGFVLGTYYDAGLTPEQEQMIMYTNARRLFGLVAGAE